MYRFILITIIGMVMSLSADAQNRKKSKYQDSELLSAESFNIAKASALKKTKRIFIPRSSIHFKKTTNASNVYGKGTRSTKVGAWANIQGVSNETKQVLADEFYAYLENGLRHMGLEVIDYNEVLSLGSYPKFSDKQIDRVYSNKTYGVNEIYTYRQGPHTKPLVGNMGIWGATTKLCKELKASALIADVTLDFTRFSIDFKKDKSVFYNAGFVNGYSYDKVYTTSSAKSAAIPQLIIRPSNGATTGFVASPTGVFIANANKLATWITLEGEYTVKGAFATNVESYKGRLPEGMKRNIRIGAHMDTGTFVITADDALFRAAAAKALRHYADGLLAAIKSVR